MRLRCDRVAALAEVLSFVGVDPHIDPQTVAAEHNLAADRRPVEAIISGDVERELRRRLAPDVARLRKRLGPTFKGWDFD